MSEILIDLGILEEGNGGNPFDELASYIEKLKMEGRLSKEDQKIEKTLLHLERRFQDFSDTNKKKSKVIFEAVVASSAWIKSDKGFTIKQLSTNLSNILHISTSSSTIDYNKFLISNMIKKDDPNKEKASAIELKNIFNLISHSIDSTKVKEEWIIELNFNTEEMDNHKPLEFIHTFIEGLNTIEGVELFLENIEIGSIKARIKAVFDDNKSKEEFKELLEDAQNSAKEKLSNDYLSEKKLDSETIKNEIETKISEDDISTLKSPEIKEFRQLETESIKLDLERKKLENDKLKLNLFKERKNLLKELLSEGIIDQKNFEMLIQGLPFLKMIDGKLSIGENIDIIDKM